MKQGRNDVCVCGSGKKYKQCCERKDKEAFLPKGITILSVAILTVVVGGFVLTVSHSGEQKTTYKGAPRRGQASTVPQAQPPGPAPAGKVWSVEHGHWHDAANPAAIQVNSTTTSPGQAPIQAGVATGTASPGRAQPGKVWSAEHGHFHEAPVAQTPRSRKPGAQGPITIDASGRVASSTPIPQPPGQPEPGKIWSAEHGHWHNAPSDVKISPRVQPARSATARPPGEAPEGKVWSAEHGHWHDAPKKSGGPSEE